ncbi:hypothetical protein BO70DRAFT_400471 [Aspergillus heteromorphus CBS 117.55]|uniref:Transmembrane protein n=1 Tax=Aspergillus heteromorphus CBS 117.55 TaxID=1448321 RepID=A0A317V1M8_9EURO|nr:uncharacterized protein BO70DRAFT_400471 [Aspergillus heteromorphus CBS 117.55]PWY67896.1 hypothetical protein BO70DRAFT_400471 [Aspergillus heteromorphus CBS 117.55]
MHILTPLTSSFILSLLHITTHIASTTAGPLKAHSCLKICSTAKESCYTHADDNTNTNRDNPPSLELCDTIHRDCRSSCVRLFPPPPQHETGHEDPNEDEGDIWKLLLSDPWSSIPLPLEEEEEEEMQIYVGEMEDVQGGYDDKTPEGGYSGRDTFRGVIVMLTAGGFVFWVIWGAVGLMLFDEEVDGGGVFECVV